MDVARRRFFIGAGAALAALRGPWSGWTARAEQAPPPAAVALDLVAAARSADAKPPLAFDGSARGPVLRIRRGQPLAVTLRNGLAEATSLQWHGMRVPNEIGGETGLVGGLLPPGGRLDQRFTPPDSGVYWFHPASSPGLPDQTAAGLVGVLIVEEAKPPLSDRDILVTLGDGPATGGPTVNGAPAPQREAIVPGGRCRLRIVSASTTRILIVAVDGARPKVIAIDGQPSDLFEPVRDAVPVGPGARFELMLDMPSEPGAVVRLLSRGIGTGEGPRPPDVTLLELTATGTPRDPLPPIAALPPNPALPPAIPLERSVRADLMIEAVAGATVGAARWRLNGTATLVLPAAPLLSVPTGGAVTIGFANRTAVPVPIRLHGHVMRLLHAKDDGWEPYWRDSVILPPDTINHVAFVADNPGRWLIESAMFDQAAFGLRHWFKVG